MNTSLREKIVELIIESGPVDRGKLEALLRAPENQGKPLAKLLIEQGLISQEKLIGLLASQLQLPAIRLSRYQIDPALAKLIPEEIVRQHQMVPFSKIGNRLSVAMADPLNVLALDDLSSLTHLQIDPAIASEEEVREAIRQLYHGSVDTMESLAQMPEDEKTASRESLSNETEAAVDLSPFGMSGRKGPIVKVVDLMIIDALRARASDIHVEPYETGVRVRYRVDGALTEAFQLPKQHQNAIITRVKIMAQLNIAENRAPQDGRFKAKMEGREVDFRVSVLPVRFGNKLVLRLLDKSNLSAGLDQLGFLPDSLKAFQEAVRRPYGMVLITGPTGSGKSTTLYSILNQLNEPGKNILTIEDPVEYQVGGISQLQVRPEIGLTFASALRAFLRQAPDVVLVGEIRDGETADIAIKASLTGQMVLSTLHTNDAASSISRLKDMGIDPFLLASSLVFVGAQRLCRQLCDQCKVPDTVASVRLKSLGLTCPPGTQLYQAKGCSICRKIGFRSRFAILEAMPVDEGLKELVITECSADAIRTHAQKQGMRTLLEEGWDHVLAGRTSLDELLRVTSED